MFSGCPLLFSFKYNNQKVKTIMYSQNMTLFNFLRYLLYFYYKLSLPKTSNKLGRATHDSRLLLALPRKNFLKGLRLLTKSKAQLRQDLMVLSSLDFKRDGFFIEFGATNGILLSNSYLLEKEYEWKGILAEPAKVWHSALLKNRSCHIETDCVWSSSNCNLSFNEVADPEISTISQYNELDEHAEKRKNGLSYQVNTISLNDLLKKYNAPKEIDFLSIDTEGSEYEILNSFNFSSYNIKIICCEHNFTPMREEILKLLSKNGYQRKYEDCSIIDDWFFKV